MDVKESLILYLNNLGINYDLLKPKQQEQFLEIEHYINTHIKNRLKCLDELKESNLNIKKISDNTSVSKATIYNNKDTLKKYIDTKLLDMELGEEKYTSLLKSSTYNDLYDKYIELEKLLEGMTIDLISMNNLKIEMKMLKDDNDELRNKIEVLYIERKKLLNEIEDLKKSIPSSKLNKIIDFRK